MSSDTPPSIPPRPKAGTAGSSTTGAAASGSARSAGSTTGATPASRPATKGTAGSTDARTSSSTTAARTTGPARTSTTPTVRTSSPAPAESPVRPAAAPAAPAPAVPAVKSETAAAAQAPAAERPAPRPVAKQPAVSTGPRRVRLTVSRVDPWSVMKLAFLISVAVGIMLVVATFVVWLTLDGLHVFSKINDLVTEVLADSDIDLMQYIALNRVVSVATLIAVVDVFLITALATIGAFLYNITAALVGGVHVTMTDD